MAKNNLIFQALEARFESGLSPWRMDERHFSNPPYMFLCTKNFIGLPVLSALQSYVDWKDRVFFPVIWTGSSVKLKIANFDLIGCENRNGADMNKEFPQTYSLHKSCKIRCKKYWTKIYWFPLPEKKSFWGIYQDFNNFRLAEECQTCWDYLDKEKLYDDFVEKLRDLEEL